MFVGNDTRRRYFVDDSKSNAAGPACNVALERCQS